MLLTGAADPGRDELVENFVETRKVAHERLEIVAINRKNVDFADGADARVARTILKERHFTEAFTGVESSDDFSLAICLAEDFDLSGDNQINPIAVIAFPKDNLTGTKMLLA